MNYQDFQEAKQTFRLHTIEKEYKPLFNARRDFVRKFNINKITSMKIDDYVIGKQSKTSFCYGIERTLDHLGRITGQPSSKFGVWYSPSTGEYKFEPRLGKDYKEAFKTVRNSIIELLKAGKSYDYALIIANPLNSLIKGKILSIYYPNDYLNIFSRQHLDYYLRSFDLDTSSLMKQDVLYKRDALLNFKDNDKDMKSWSVDMFAHFLHSHYPKAPSKAEELAVIPSEDIPEFPTIENISFVDLQLSNSNPSSTYKPHSSNSSPDYEKEAKKYKKLGDRGEYIVIQAEIERLMNELSISEKKARKLIHWVSRESDAYGYDIKSVNKNMTPRYIEVKATQRKVGDLNFYYTENEFEMAKQYGKNYYIYIVYEILTPQPKIWVIKNPFSSNEGVSMKPVKYKVHLSTTKEI